MGWIVQWSEGWTCTRPGPRTVKKGTGHFLLLTGGLSKSSKLKVRAVWAAWGGTRGPVRLSREGLRIPSRPKSVRGGGALVAAGTDTGFVLYRVPVSWSRTDAVLPEMWPVNKQLRVQRICLIIQLLVVLLKYLN